MQIRLKVRHNSETCFMQNSRSRSHHHRTTRCCWETQLARAQARILINNHTLYHTLKHCSQFFRITISFCCQIGPHSDTQSENPYPQVKVISATGAKNLTWTDIPLLLLCPCSQFTLSRTFFWKFQFFIAHIYMQKSRFTKTEEILKQRKRRTFRKPWSRSNKANSTMCLGENRN